ncbi:hypothetical protein ABZW32_35620 [Streptomyces sp. NPDC004667]
MSEEIETTGLLLVDRFQSCAAAPDDLDAAAACDETLTHLDELLRAAG